MESTNPAAHVAHIGGARADSVQRGEIVGVAQVEFGVDGVERAVQDGGTHHHVLIKRPIQLLELSKPHRITHGLPQRSSTDDLSGGGENNVRKTVKNVTGGDGNPVTGTC